MIYLFGLTGSIAAFLLFIATRSNSFRVARSRSIHAPALTLFGLINSFHGWKQWSPWDKIDPNLSRWYDGPAAGPGAIYRWNGNNKVGQGQMTVLSATPDSRIEIEVQFIKPSPRRTKRSSRSNPTATRRRSRGQWKATKTSWRRRFTRS